MPAWTIQTAEKEEKLGLREISREMCWNVQLRTSLERIAGP